jgi:hypothetical protein
MKGEMQPPRYTIFRRLPLVSGLAEIPPLLPIWADGEFRPNAAIAS